MITSVKLINFQKHKSKTIDLGPVTMLIGPTDSGKSAVMRAIRWACLNDMDGATADDFQRTGSESHSVQLTVDGHIIERKRGKQNLYKLDGEIYKAFGNNVPQDIAEILQVSEYNFQEQVDQTFGFSLRPGELSKHLNRIVNLDKIDSVLTNAGLRLRRSKTRVDLCVDRLENLKTQKQRLAYVPDMVKAYKQISRKIETRDRIAATLSQLQLLVNKVSQAKDEQKTARAKAVEGKEIRLKAEKVVGKAVLLLPIKKLVEAIDEERKIVRKAKELVWPKSLDTKIEQIESIYNKMTPLHHILHEIAQARSLQRNTSIAYVNSLNELNKLTKGLCPICQSPLKS